MREADSLPSNTLIFTLSEMTRSHVHEAEAFEFGGAPFSTR